MKHFFFIITFLVGLYSTSHAQYEKLEITELNYRSINRDDTIATFHVINSKDICKAKSDKTYYWYKTNTILITTGGFDGWVLDGIYKSSYPNKNLNEWGYFKNGLKCGEWKSWYSSGKIRTIVHWRKGEKSGLSETYYESGNLRQISYYKADKLNGTVTDFDIDGKETKTIYKHGIQYAARASK